MRLISLVATNPSRQPLSGGTGGRAAERRPEPGAGTMMHSCQAQSQVSLSGAGKFHGVSAEQAPAFCFYSFSWQSEALEPLRDLSNRRPSTESTIDFALALGSPGSLHARQTACATRDIQEKLRRPSPVEASASTRQPRKACKTCAAQRNYVRPKNLAA